MISVGSCRKIFVRLSPCRKGQEEPFPGGVCQVGSAGFAGKGRELYCKHLRKKQQNKFLHVREFAAKALPIRWEKRCGNKG